MRPLLERVARAIALSRGGAMVGPGECLATREFGWKPDGSHLDKYVAAHWKEHEHAAQLAIDTILAIPAPGPDAVPLSWMLARWRINRDPKDAAELIERLVSLLRETGLDFETVAV